MIKHIVVWKLKDRSKAETMKAALDGLPAAIPQIREFQVGICMEGGETLADIALVSSFETKADLQAYVVHPAHQKVVAIIRELAAERRVADYVV